MNEDTITTAKEVELTDAHLTPPPSGATVLALTHGNVLVRAVWTSQSIHYFDAWCYMPRRSASVKERQIARLKFRG